jgi:DNA-binding IclR family transcriptional regulator
MREERALEHEDRDTGLTSSEDVLEDETGVVARSGGSENRRMTPIAEEAESFLASLDESSRAGSNGMLHTLARGLSILEAMATSPGRHGLSQAALARQLGFQRSTLYRYLACLQELGFVEATDNARYRLGPRVLVLGAASNQERGFPRYTRQFVTALAQATGETAHATIYDQGHAVTIELAEGAGPIGPRISLGMRRPAHCSASGKVFLAHGTHRMREEFLERELEAMTATTIVEPDAFRMELEAVRRQSFAKDLGECVEGICCMAAPVFDSRSEVAGALSVSVAADELTPSLMARIGTPLMHSTRAFSRLLGCPEVA